METNSIFSNYFSVLCKLQINTSNLEKFRNASINILKIFFLTLLFNGLKLDYHFFFEIGIIAVKKKKKILDSSGE